MNVHESISKHSNQQHRHLVAFSELDAEREAAIEAAVAKCKAGEAFDVEAINNITAKINKHAKEGISPTRKYVTAAMLEQFVRKQS